MALSGRKAGVCDRTRECYNGKRNGVQEEQEGARDGGGTCELIHLTMQCIWNGWLQGVTSEKGIVMHPVSGWAPGQEHD
jgi:hypothetical protein